MSRPGGSLISALHRLQEAHGYLRQQDLREMSRQQNVPLYRLQGLATFYPHFRTTPPSAARVSVCRDMSCHLAGAGAFRRRVDDALASERTAGTVEVESVSCLGLCDAAPAAAVDDAPAPGDPQADLDQRTWQVATWAREPGTRPDLSPAPSGRKWRADPYDGESSHYGVLAALLEADGAAGGRFGDETAQRLLLTLKEAGLRGMGGAGFPAHVKWSAVRSQEATPRYVVVNADESEPGTFKDRQILDDLPHLVVEGAVLAALVAGADKVIIYLRHEYVRQRRALAAEICRFRDRQMVDLAVEIFVSPGGYILGEETALLEALEDRRGEPRNKPPFPVSHGLKGQPTVINNVETLAMVPAILEHGHDWWRDQGREGFAGLKFLAVSGHVARPGVYEFDLGTPLGEVIAAAGGVSGGRELLALAPGGASSPFLPAAAIDVPVDFDSLAKAGSMLGSGAVVVVAAGTDLVELARNVVTFFRNESCGKCVPCRTGTEKAVRILDDLNTGRGSRAAVELLPQLGETLALTSICGLGQVALNPILSVLRHFPGEVERHLGGHADQP